MPYIIWAIIWVVIAVLVLKVIEKTNVSQGQKKVETLINEAESKKVDILKEANLKADKIIEESKRDSGEILKKAEKIEERILNREEKIQTRLDEIELKQEWLLKQEEEYKSKVSDLKEKEKSLDSKLGEIAKLTEEEARDLFISKIKVKYDQDIVWVLAKYKKSVEDRKQEITKEVIIKSMQQYAWDVTSEVTTTIIPLANDDLKWKLIGKEWRNITAFERSTWVALIIDDTPDSVFISAFDLFKRYIAKKSLEKLLEDWRIQPARIEEVVEKITEDAQVLLKEIWEKTLFDLNITAIPEDLVPLVGKLRFRTSYGQNILKHSIEVAILAENLAKEFWLDSNLVKVGWLLHDIGKALDHDIEGWHPEIWWKVARKYWLDEKLTDMIENHHGDSISISIEASIVQLADAISSIRPGARRESIELYIKRVKEMESLVASFPWVSKVFAVSAWREVRVYVDSDTVSDVEAFQKASDIANAIHDKLNYPWEVRVNLIRELRVIEYAK